MPRIERPAQAVQPAFCGESQAGLSVALRRDPFENALLDVTSDFKWPRKSVCCPGGQILFAGVK